jgi:isocitrate/isopropylmalate dehydrogenase
MAKKLKILIVAGDGIGPEVTGEAVRVLESVAELGGYDFEFRQELIGGVAIKAHGTPLPDATLKAALESDAVLLGAVGSNEFNALPPRSGSAEDSLGVGWVCEFASFLRVARTVAEFTAAAGDR